MIDFPGKITTRWSERGGEGGADNSWPGLYYTLTSYRIGSESKFFGVDILSMLLIESWKELWGISSFWCRHFEYVVDWEVEKNCEEISSLWGDWMESSVALD